MLIEVRYYSPTDYEIHHYGLLEAPTFQAATDKLRAAGKPLRLGSEPLSFQEVKNTTTHNWGKGFSIRLDLTRRLVP